jgi:nicotinamidase-related amidase
VPLIDRDESVLVAVDAQPGFVAAGEAAPAALDRAIWLASIATLLGIPAVVTEEGAEREGRTDPRLLERLAAGTPVFAKPAFGLAGCPEIVAAIRATGRSTAVLIGFETDVCVSQSAIGLRDLGFRVAVVTDACQTATAAQHEHGLRRMAQAGVELVHCKGVAFEWMRTVELAIETTRRAAALGPVPGSL